jgi:hypothetical protein
VLILLYCILMLLLKLTILIDADMITKKQKIGISVTNHDKKLM